MSNLSNIKWFFKERYRVVEATEVSGNRTNKRYIVQRKLRLTTKYENLRSDFILLEDAIHYTNKLIDSRKPKVIYEEV